jgi:hypothetical protein
MKPFISEMKTSIVMHRNISDFMTITEDIKYQRVDDVYRIVLKAFFTRCTSGLAAVPCFSFLHSNGRERKQR